MTIAMYSRTSWREVEPDFTVGQTDGEFTGTIERIEGRFRATSNVGQRLGAYRSRDAAERALERSALRRGQIERPVSSRESIVVKASLILGGIAATGAVALMGAVAL